MTLVQCSPYRNQSTTTGSIKFSTLIVLLIATAFFPRVLTEIGFPAAVNFLHFALIIVLAVIVIPKVTGTVSKQILVGLGLLFSCIIISAIFNQAGITNVVLDFLLLAEPFLLLLAITGTQMNQKSIKRLQFWLLTFACIHLLFANFQYFVYGLRADYVKGVFLNQGAGHHVGGSISGAAALFIFFSTNPRPRWLRFVLPPIFLAQIIQCDAKQIILEYLIAVLLLALTKVGNPLRFIGYLIGAIGIIYITFTLAFALFPDIAGLLSPDRVIQSLQQKLTVFPVMLHFYNSPLDWLFGLGPGHSISRLSWMIPDYSSILEPLGATSTTVFQAVFAAQEAQYFTNSITGSSLYSLLFSWAGIWGDLGLLGLGAYLYLWSVIWRQCQDELAKFFLLSIFVSGLIFTWMEEPAFMLYTVSLVGLQWQRHQQSILRKLQFRARRVAIPSSIL